MGLGTFGKRIAGAVAAELERSREMEAQGALAASFRHLERAHVLGQAATLHHVRVHVAMFRWALRHGRWSQARGQILRIVGAATKTAFGMLPHGNTGGANVSPFQAMAVPPDLARTIRAARKD